MANQDPIPDEIAPDLADFANAQANAWSAVLGIKKDAPWLNNAVVQALITIIGVVLRLATRIAANVAKILQKLMEEDNPEVGRLAIAVVGTLFGHEIADSIPGNILNPGNLDETAGRVGAGVLAVLFGAIDDGGGQELEPSTEGVERYLGSIANLVTRGFVMDLLEEIVPHWKLQFIHHLEESLINGLGLGRVARAALRPYVQTLLATPAEWKVHQAYRPTLLSEGDAARQFLIGNWSSDELGSELGRKGFSDDRIDAIVDGHRKRPSVEQLFHLAEHNIIDEADAIDRVRASGYEADVASLVWEALKAAEDRSLLMAEAGVYLQKYEEGLLTHDEFVRNLRTLGLPDHTAQLLINIGGARVETPRRLLSEGQLREAWNKSVLTQQEYHDGVVRLGYSEEDATTLVLLNLSNVRDKEEAAQARKQAAADRAAALAAKKQQAAADAAAKKAAAAAERQAKAAALAAHKQKIAADQLALKTFIAAAARQKQALVDQLHQQQLITTDAAAIARGQIDADEQALLASLAGQEAAAKASYERQLLELRQADREATVAQQLADVDLALEADQAVRKQIVATRERAVDDVLAQKLADLDDIYAARAQSIEDDLAAGIDAINAAALPSMAERRAAATLKIGEVDAELARRTSDTHDDYTERRAAVAANLDDGLIKPNAAALEHNRLTVSEDTAIRLAQQQHDISVARLQGVADQAEALATHEADKQKTALVNKSEAARKTLAADKLKAQLAARQAADTEKIGLATIASQIAPITEAEAARRRRTIQTAAASAQRQETITETEIAKGEASAKATIDKANTSVAAARARLKQTAAAGGARESAAQAAAAAIAALAAQLDAQRAELEAQLAADQAAAPSEGSA
jgi:hypothetical protein